MLSKDMQIAGILQDKYWGEVSMLDILCTSFGEVHKNIQHTKDIQLFDCMWGKKDGQLLQP